MFGFIKTEKKNPKQERYSKLLKAARKAYKSGDLQQYKTLVAETNHALIEMFSSDKNTGTHLRH